MGVRRFFHSEAAGGVLLMAAAALAMLVANSPLADGYFHFQHRMLGPLSVLHWINDGLMALFFLLVGLEIKGEFIGGRLAQWSDRMLPTVAAASGMAVPAIVYLFVVRGSPELGRGWAIPSATDIAFAIGVMALLGSRAPASLKLFLATVAVVDDMGAVIVIAVAYTSGLNLLALGAAAVIMALLYLLNRFGVRFLWPYLLLALFLWVAILLSGVHATVAGVLAALFIPLRLPHHAQSPLLRLQHALHTPVNFLIVPLFGFANAGVSFAGIGVAQILAPLPMAIAAGLFIGKQAGIFSAIWVCDRMGIARRPARASWAQTYGACLLCGIGFTMSLFIGGLAFDSPRLMDDVKIGVLLGSLASALAGYAVLRVAPEAAFDRPNREAGA